MEKYCLQQGLPERGDIVFVAEALSQVSQISPYLGEKSSDCHEILYTAADFELNERHVIKNENFQNSRWRTAVILKIVISPYLREKSSDFDEIL